MISSLEDMYSPELENYVKIFKLTVRFERREKGSERDVVGVRETQPEKNLVPLGSARIRVG